MLDFANPYYLLFLLAIPVVCLLYLMSRASIRAKLKKFGRPDIIAALMPDVSRYKPMLKLILRIVALAAIVIAIARPRHGEKEESSTTEGAEVVVAFDVSRSMLAASTDDPGSMSRIQRARMLLEKLIDNMHNDRVGLVVFASQAHILMPLTSDRRLIQMSMKNDLSPGMLSNQGTSLSNALVQSLHTFPEISDILDKKAKKTSENMGVHRAIILITDAEDHQGDAIKTAQMCTDYGVQVDVIGVGSEHGAKIPLGDNGQYFRYDGQEVVTALNSEAAAKIAEAGGGIYVNAADPAALQDLRESLDTLKKSKLTHVVYKMNAEQFPLFAWIALIFLILDIAIVERKTAWLKGIDFFTGKIKKSGFTKIGRKRKD